MAIINVSIALISLASSLVALLSNLEFWQRKEYRWDRVRTTLSTNALKKTITLHAGIIAITILLALFHVTFALLVGLGAEATYYTIRAFKKGIFQPSYTTKALLVIFTATFLYAAFLLTIAPQYGIATFLAALFLVPAFTALSVAMINLITNPRKKHIIDQAILHRRSLTQLTTVGITGSYGKTSTKNFLHQLLPDIQVSPAHQNNDLVIAQDMLQRLNNQSTTYVAEMGAYTIGEIKTLAGLVRPTIGVITGIGNQHLDLFGSQENILKAKWELIESLPKNGVAVLNADDSLLKKQAATRSGRTIWFSTSNPDADVYAANITWQAGNITCTIHVATQSAATTIPLAGHAALHNTLAAIAAAHALGTSFEKIVQRLPILKPFDHTMEIKQGRSGATVIDDGYASNEQGVHNALDHLTRLSSPDKRIAMVPLIELGAAGPAVHQRLGQVLAKTRADVYIYHDDYADDITTGGTKVDPDFRPRFFTNPEDLVQALTSNVTSDTVILIEGRLPQTIVKTILTP